MSTAAGRGTTVAGRRPAGVRVAVPYLDQHASTTVVAAFVQALVDAGLQPVRIPRRIGVALARSGIRPPRASRAPVVVPLMGPRFDLLHAACLFGTPVPFCWDVWEPRWDDWVAALARIRPPLVVATAVQSAEHLRARLPGIRVEHLPEAVDLPRYLPGAQLVDRGTDVLELGRRNDAWHAAVTGPAGRAGLRHLYELGPGRLVFGSDEQDLLHGLADSKVSVCFPSSVTHPLRSGSVSTLTHRYLESIASRCVVLGQAPTELTALLGCDPVVPADPRDPWEQLRSVLDTIGDHQQRVDLARERLRAVGDWRTRARQLAALLDEL